MSQELPDERGLRLEYVRLYETPRLHLQSLDGSG